MPIRNSSVKVQEAALTSTDITSSAASPAPDDINTMAGWAFRDIDIQEAANGNRLLNPSIDLSNPCNLNCPYCFVEQKESVRKLRLPDELYPHEMLSLIRGLASGGARTVNIVGAGEPTIDPAFEQIVREVSSRGMTPVVFTNGIRLAERPHLVDFLYDTDATVVIKYNSSKGAIQDLVSGRRGYTSQRDRAVEALVNRGFSSHIPTRLAFDTIAFRGVLDEIPSIVRECRRTNIFPIVADFIPCGRTEHGEFVGRASLQTIPPEFRDEVVRQLQPLNRSERSALYRVIKHIDEDEFGIRHREYPAYYTGSPCMQLLGLYIDIRGDIWPCVARSQRSGNGAPPAPLGNIRVGANPSEVWHSHPRITRIRTSYDGRCPFKLTPSNDAQSAHDEAGHG